MKSVKIPTIDGITNWLMTKEDFIAQIIINFAIALILLVIGIFIARAASAGLRKLMTSRNIDHTVTQFCCTLLRYAFLTFAIIAALGRLGVETSSIIAVVGAAGLAIGLALQGSLSNFAAGVLLVSLRPFKVGEYTEMGGMAGTVEEVHIFSTTLRTVDNKSVVMPNGKIISGDIINYSRHPVRRIDLTIGVGYNADISEVKEVIMGVITLDKRIMKNHDITVRLIEMAASSLNFTVRVWVRNEEYWNVYFDLLESIKISLDKSSIAIPFPQIDIHLHKGKLLSAG